MKRIFLLLLVAICWLGSSSLAVAQDTILIADNSGPVGSSSACVHISQVPTGIRFSLFYGESLSTPDPQLGPVTVEAGQVGEFIFDAQNSPGFPDVASLLTNGIDDQQWLEFTQVQGSTPIGGSTGFSLESQALDGLNPLGDLAGWTVDFARLIVGGVSISFDPVVGCPVDTGRVTVSSSFNWEFWGGNPENVSSMGGGRSDVDSFLTFVNPVQRRTTLAFSPQNDEFTNTDRP